jgi:peroxiredoxin
MSATEATRTPLPGETAPDFQVLDSTGLPQKLSSLAAKRPLVLIFYRGYW